MESSKTNTRNQTTITEPLHYMTGSVTSKDGTIIGYRQLGHGPGLVMVHGAMESIQSHIQLAEAMADTFSVYLYDRRGRGLSGPHGKGYSLQKEVEDLEALLAKTGTHNIFGVSSGAIISLQAALTLSAVHKAAIFEPPLISDAWSTAFIARYEKEIAEGKVASALVTASKGTQMWGHVLPRWILVLLTRMMLASEDKNAKDHSITMRALAPTFHYDAQLVSQTKGTLERYKDIRAEIILLGGGKSPAFLKAALDSLEKVFPHAKRTEFPGLNHGATGNTDRGGQPKLVAQELKQFFA